MPQIDEECAEAYSNPNCPYVTQINSNAQNIFAMCRDIKEIKQRVGKIETALIGDDMQGGLIKSVHRNVLINKAILAITSMLIAAVVGVLVKGFFG